MAFISLTISTKTYVRLYAPNLQTGKAKRPNSVYFPIFIFSIYCANKLKKIKKRKKFAAKFCKKMFFLSLHQHAGRNVLFPEKHVLLASLVL